VNFGINEIKNIIEMSTYRGVVVRRGRAATGFAKAETLAAPLRVGFFEIESSLVAVVARRPVDIFLAEAVGVVLVANFRGGSPEVAVALGAVGERVRSGLALVASSTDHVFLATAKAHDTLNI